jgi:hypothetical protein
MNYLLWRIEVVIKLMVEMIVFLIILLFFISLVSSLYQAIIHKQPFFKVLFKDFKRRIVKMLDVIF